MHSSDPPRRHPEDLDDSWFDLPVITPAPKKQRAPEDELDDSWFDRPGRGIRRKDVPGL
jgi:hypothetical protein